MSINITQFKIMLWPLAKKKYLYAYLVVSCGNTIHGLEIHGIAYLHTTFFIFHDNLFIELLVILFLKLSYIKTALNFCNIEKIVIRRKGSL